MLPSFDGGVVFSGSQSRSPPNHRRFFTANDALSHSVDVFNLAANRNYAIYLITYFDFCNLCVSIFKWIIYSSSRF